MTFEKTLHNGDAPQLFDILPAEGYNSMWSSPEKFARHVAQLDRKQAWSDSGWDKGSSFYGTETMEDALDLALNGWKEGAEHVEKARKYIQGKNPMMKQPVRYDIAGVTPSVPRAVAGDIKNMRAPADALTRKRPIITILVNACASCGVDEDILNNRSAVIAAVVDQIEAAGFCCEVIVSARASRGYREKGGWAAVTSMIAKPSHQPVDVKRLAFALGHASMFRRLTFADWGHSQDAKQLGGCMGMVSQINPDSELAEKHVYVIPGANKSTNEFKTMDSAATKGVDYVLTLLREQGCPVFKNYKSRMKKVNKEKLFSDDMMDWDEPEYEDAF